MATVGQEWEKLCQALNDPVMIVGPDHRLPQAVKTDVDADSRDGDTLSRYAAGSGPGAAGEEAGGKKSVSGGGDGARIMLVEDEPAVRDAANIWLSRNGYVVFAASDAPEARTIFEREGGRLDLVFSDMVMPGETGLDLVTDLLEQKPGLGAIIASGYGGERFDVAEIKAKGIHFIQKPYTLYDLLCVVREVLGQ